MTDRQKYWFDTDPGIDDALAIALAILEGGEQILGFSSSYGNHPEAVSALNLARLLSELEARQLSPARWQPFLLRGAARPLVREPFDSGGVHGPDGLGGVSWQARLPWRDFLKQETRSLAEALPQTSDLTLICLAPLTNLAQTIQARPALVEQVERLVIMGGSIQAGGNSSMAAEYNFDCDPEAAHLVLQAGFKDLWLVPLDAALSCRFQAEHLARLEKIQTAAARCVRELMVGWEERIRQRGQGMYDLVAWLLVNHPEWAEWKEVFVDVDTAGGLAYGASLADWRGRSGKAPNLKAALSVKGELMWDYFLEKLANEG